MVQKVSVQKGVTFYIAERGKCVDIDIDDDVTALTFARMRDASISNLQYGVFAPSYFLRDVKKQFPNIKEIVIEQGVDDIDISNMMFPNVRRVSSRSYSYATGSMLIKTGYNEARLENTFCRNQDEVVDLHDVILIDSFAFEGCKSVDIVNSNNVAKINDNAFVYSIFAEKKPFTNGICTIGAVLVDIEPGATEITLPDGIKSIYTGADTNINNIKCIKTANVKNLNAFSDSSLFLDSVIIDTDEYIEMPDIRTYAKRPNAFNLFVRDSNPFYCSINGVIFTKDKKKLIAYPSGREGAYKIPEGTEVIYDSAFINSRISSVKIPDSVTEIGYAAFCDCHDLSDIGFGRGISDYDDKGGSNIFARCTSLKTLKIPAYIKTIGASMFSGCEFKSLELEEGVDTISGWAFDSVDFEEITLPRSLKKMCGNNFNKAKTINVYERIPEGLISNMVSRCRRNAGRPDRDIDTDNLLLKLVITDDKGKKTLYIPRYIYIGNVTSSLDLRLSNFSWRLFPQSYFNSLFIYCDDDAITQDTAIAMYQHDSSNEEAAAYLKSHSRKIVNRLLKENQEKQLAKFVGLGFLSERVLNTLLKTTQKNGMNTATSYILEMQQKSSNKKKRKTTSFRI
mgnify:FL=1